MQVSSWDAMPWTGGSAAMVTVQAVVLARDVGA